MNNATKLPVYKARAIFSEQRLKNTLFPKRKGMTGEEGEMSLAGLSITPLVWAPKSRSGLLMEGLFMILPNPHLTIAILKQLCVFFCAENTTLGAT